MATAVEAVQTKFQILPLAQITPSPMNPRKRFDEKALKELAASIKAHGVQQPIVVRPHGKPGKLVQFEIVVGERRYRASELAGKTEIPALINSLSDAAALEIMVIENLQREDVHPLDEALGYEALMKKSGLCGVCNRTNGHALDCARKEETFTPVTADSIAVKVGKSVGYVYARLKLLALCPAAREAFEQDHITAGHAVLLARLQPKDQLQGLAACFTDHITTFEHDKIRKLDATKAAFADVYTSYSDRLPRLMPEKGLREWIQENVNLSLKSVPWDLADAKLLPEAGSCGACLKRSVSNPSLFLGLTRANDHDNCFDPECFHKKQKAFVKLQVKFAKADEKELVQISEQTAYTKPKEGEKVLKQGQWLPAKKGECEGVTKALIVRGENAGEYQTVCADLNCKVHKRHLQSSSSRATDFNPEQPKRDEEAEKREIERLRKFKLLLFGKVRAKLNGASRPVLQMVFQHFCDNDNIYQHDGLVELRGWKGTPQKVLTDKIASLSLAKAWELMAEIILWTDVADEFEELGRFLPDAAKEYKVDIKKLSAEFEKSQTPAKPANPAKAAKTKAKAAGK